MQEGMEPPGPSAWPCLMAWGLSQPCSPQKQQPDSHLHQIQQPDSHPTPACPQSNSQIHTCPKSNSQTHRAPACPLSPPHPTRNLTGAGCLWRRQPSLVLPPKHTQSPEQNRFSCHGRHSSELVQPDPGTAQLPLKPTGFLPQKQLYSLALHQQSTRQGGWFPRTSHLHQAGEG